MKVIKRLSLLLLVILLGFCGSCSQFLSSNNLSQANEDEVKLVDYIIENGTYNEESKTYAILETADVEGENLLSTISYNKETQGLTFAMYITAADGLLISMDYIYGSDEQNVTMTIAMGNNEGIALKGIIYPATYTSSNRTIYSFESTYEEEGLNDMFEDMLYIMLTQCQLLMIDADVSIKSFGFEKGLFE